MALGELPLEVHYGGSHVPSPGVTFTYRENPVLLSFQPLRSFVRCGLSVPSQGQPGSSPHANPQLLPSSFCFPGLAGCGQAGLGVGGPLENPTAPPDQLPPRHPDGLAHGPLEALWSHVL